MSVDDKLRKSLRNFNQIPSEEIYLIAF